MVDIEPARAELARALGAGFATPDAAPADCDLVFHASGSAAGLATALRLAGDEATIVELSWYGAGDVAVPLGEAFHSRRLRLISSQVGQVAPSHRAALDPARRLWRRRSRCWPIRRSMRLLAPPVAVRRPAGASAGDLRREGDARCPLIRYPAADRS